MRILLLLSFVFILSCKKNAPDPVKAQQSGVDTVVFISAGGCYATTFNYTVLLKDDSSGDTLKTWSGYFVYDGLSSESNPEWFIIKLDGIPKSGSYCMEGTLANSANKLSYCGQIGFKKINEESGYFKIKNYPDYYTPNINGGIINLFHVQTYDTDGNPICN